VGPCLEQARRHAFRDRGQLTQAIERRGMRRIEMNDAVGAAPLPTVLAGERQLDLRKCRSAW